MPVISCKQCGYAEVEFKEGATVGVCPACGSMITFPRLTSEHKKQLYDRAEYFRQHNDFDRAVDAYEAIVRETPDDPEAYWGLVLSRFGIEYVEDPLTHERVPTCHRVQYDSILTDGDYKSALEHADAAQQDIYESEAKRISDIQKGILAISAQEKPFDVFICYKETTEGGSRTKDSVIAQDIYDHLVNAGYKVFFARVTLEDKLGQQYEPYIFAALNSAKVMLVIGSKKEYFNAVWVKNEWSRFLALMKKDRSRLLIPCYRDMDAYDIPEELAMLQSQDMSKIGFNQDLLHGIKKVLGSGKSSAMSAASATAGSEVEPLIKRIRIFLKTGDFSQAREYCNKVLDKDPENSEVYLSLLLAEKRLKSEEELYTLDEKLESLKNFQLAMDFADAPVKARLQAYVKKQKDEWRYKELVGQFQKLDRNDASFKRYNELRGLVDKFEALGSYRDSDNLKSQCEERADAIKKQKQDEYSRLVEKKNAMIDGKSSPEEWKALADKFRKYSDFLPEAEEMARQCIENALTLTYRMAMEHKNAKEFDKAIEVFSKLGEYEDSKGQILQCRELILQYRYEAALLLRQEKRYKEAIKQFTALDGYADSSEQIRLCRFENALLLRQEKRYAEAIELFTDLGGYADSSEQIRQCQREIKEENNRRLRKKYFIILCKVACIAAIVVAVFLMVNKVRCNRLKKEAQTAYEQGDWQRLESLGKKLTELSAEEGAALLGRARELRKVVEEEIKTGLRPYMVVSLQSWTVRYSKTSPDLSDDACRTTELWLRWIPPGSFTMGSPKNELGRDDGEIRHKVTLTSGYWMGIFEVTQKQWSLLMGSNPSRYRGGTRPVVKVSYNFIRGAAKGAGWPSGGHDVDADSFLGKLRSKIGLAFDLPTEAQWEYACRAGTTTALNSGKNLTDDTKCPNMAEVGNYIDNDSDGKGGYGKYTKVGSYKPNAWGLYDMHGNVPEWCLDWYGDYPASSVTDPQGPESGSYRVVRGGGWGSNAQYCRSARRSSFDPSGRYGYFGFRVVLLP